MDDILSGLSEADKVLYNCPDFIILPDMKWDLTTMSAFYILAIARDASIRSLRDLTKNKGHVQLLKSIRTEASRAAQERFGLPSDRLRMFVHYQPSYCAYLSLVTVPKCIMMSMSNRSIPRPHCPC